ncbi:paraquat-inducible protein A [Oceanimonas sp. NS1]|nr:paraquat-inducible protein A [Oceanimonas sp. NS1]
MVVSCGQQEQHQLDRLRRIRLYRMTEFVGRWSMVDVFVVAILVALIRNGNLMSIEPGPAALAFAAVVVLTMLAAMLFDQRSIWAGTDTGQDNNDNKESEYV